MDRKPIVKVKLKHDWLSALQVQYFNTINAFVSETEHDELLNEHAAEIHARLMKLLGKEQHNYTVELTSTQAMAFMQYWMMIPVPAGTLQQVTISKIIQAIDKKAKHHARTTMQQIPAHRTVRR